MIPNRTTLLALLTTTVLLVVGVAVVVSTLRARPAAEPIPTLAPASVPTPTPASAPVPITSTHVPILMYHHLTEVGVDADAEYQQLSVSPGDFQQQVTYLQDNGYRTITFAELVGAFGGQVSLPSKPVIITFDDGWDDIYHVAYPVLRDHGMRATFFIPTNWVENLDGVVSWAQIEEMSRGGMEFGSHSVTHPYLTTYDPDWLRFELEESKAALEEHTGKAVTALAYPFGLYDDTVMTAVHEAGYRAACTIEQDSTVYAGQLLTLPRLWVYGWTTLGDFEALLSGSG